MIFLLVLADVFHCLTRNVGASDILLPYPNSKHLDPARTHRYVRSCLKLDKNNASFEVINTNINNDRTEIYKIRIHKENPFGQKNQIVFGHRAVVKNPLKLVSVLEPLQPKSCQLNIVSTVKESMKQQDCHIAINAGFFNPTTGKNDSGKCYGNIVSNGRYVQDSGGIQNANFGIRQDGSIVIGYLSEEDVLSHDNPFVQLISGVGWVLRNGSLYLEESLKAECSEIQTTGSLRGFFNVYSARTLIGYDKSGYVHIVQFDGKTNEIGVNLEQAAKYMQSIGVINAINFDGGGSATFAVDGLVVNYPTENCHDGVPGDICSRNVSTIICVKKATILYDENMKQSERFVDLSNCCNQNYLVVIGLVFLVAIIMLVNVFLLHLYLTYRSRVYLLTNTSHQNEAMKSLLDHTATYSADSEEDEL